MNEELSYTKNLFEKIKEKRPELDVEYIKDRKLIQSKHLIHNRNTNFKFGINAFIVNKGKILYVCFDFGEIIPNAEVFQLVNDFNRESVIFYRAYLQYSKFKVACHFKVEFHMENKNINEAADNFLRNIDNLNDDGIANLIKPIYSFTAFGRENNIERMS